VVIGPLSALGAVAYALVPRWRSWLRWLVFLGAFVTAASAWIARASGEFLEPLVTQGRPATGDLARHITWATRLIYATWGWLALVVVFCLLVPMALRQRATTPVATNVVSGVLLVAGAAALVVLTVITGDAASHAVWGGYIK
jgi:hypothetical protein